jgi:hypothetical protein
LLPHDERQHGNALAEREHAVGGLRAETAEFDEVARAIAFAGLQHQGLAVDPLRFGRGGVAGRFEQFEGLGTAGGEADPGLPEGVFVQLAAQRQMGGMLVGQPDLPARGHATAVDREHRRHLLRGGVLRQQRTPQRREPQQRLGVVRGRFDLRLEAIEQRCRVGDHVEAALAQRDHEPADQQQVARLELLQPHRLDQRPGRVERQQALRPRHPQAIGGQGRAGLAPFAALDELGRRHQRARRRLIGVVADRPRGDRDAAAAGQHEFRTERAAEPLHVVVGAGDGGLRRQPPQRPSGLDVVGQHELRVQRRAADDAVEHHRRVVREVDGAFDLAMHRHARHAHHLVGGDPAHAAGRRVERVDDPEVRRAEQHAAGVAQRRGREVGLRVAEHVDVLLAAADQPAPLRLAGAGVVGGHAELDRAGPVVGGRVDRVAEQQRTAAGVVAAEAPRARAVEFVEVRPDQLAGLPGERVQPPLRDLPHDPQAPVEVDVHRAVGDLQGRDHEVVVDAAGEHRVVVAAVAVVVRLVAHRRDRRPGPAAAQRIEGEDLVPGVDVDAVEVADRVHRVLPALGAVEERCCDLFAPEPRQAARGRLARGGPAAGTAESGHRFGAGRGGQHPQQVVADRVEPPLAGLGAGELRVAQHLGLLQPLERAQFVAAADRGGIERLPVVARGFEAVPSFECQVAEAQPGGPPELGGGEPFGRQQQLLRRQAGERCLQRPGFPPHQVFVGLLGGGRQVRHRHDHRDPEPDVTARTDRHDAAVVGQQQPVQPLDRGFVLAAVEFLQGGLVGVDLLLRALQREQVVVLAGGEVDRAHDFAVRRLGGEAHGEAEPEQQDRGAATGGGESLHGRGGHRFGGGWTWCGGWCGGLAVGTNCRA